MGGGGRPPPALHREDKEVSLRETNEVYKCQALVRNGRQCPQPAHHSVGTQDGLTFNLCSRCLDLLLAREPVAVIATSNGEEASDG